MERLPIPLLLFVAVRVLIWTAMPILFALTWTDAAPLPVLIVSFGVTNALLAVALYYSDTVG